MPYRAMMITVVTVTLALIVVGMWVRAIAPVLAQARASTRPAASMPQGVATATGTGPAFPAATEPTAATSVSRLIRGTMLLSFMLICLMLIVGIFASFREWLRYRALLPMTRMKKTRYVDAWKIAGERAKPPPVLPPEEDEAGPGQ